MASPEMVLQELSRTSEAQVDEGEFRRVRDEVAMLDQSEKRLVRLFGYGEGSEATVRDELRLITRQRSALRERLDAIQCSPELPAFLDATQLRSACSAIAEWLESAGDEDRALVLEAPTIPALEIAIPPPLPLVVQREGRDRLQ